MYYSEELQAVQCVLGEMDKIIYLLEEARADMTYSPAVDAIERFFAQTTEPMADLYAELKNCEQNIQMEMLFWEKDDD